MRETPLQDAVCRWLRRNLGRVMEIEDLAEACGTTVGSIKVTVWKLRRNKALAGYTIESHVGRGNCGYRLVRAP